MLKRVLIICLLFAAPPALADAERVREYIVRELREDGYSSIRMSRTWLGRMRFVAETSDRRREIVVNPATGVILRDYIRWLIDDDDNLSPDGPGVEEDDDDEGGEDDEDDEDDEDNSGSGSSNSGSGSGEDDEDSSGSGSSSSGSGSGGSDDDD